MDDEFAFIIECFVRIFALICFGWTGELPEGDARGIKRDEVYRCKWMVSVCVCGWCSTCICSTRFMEVRGLTLTVKLIVLTSFICCSDHKLFGSKPLPNDLKVMVKTGAPPKTNGWNLKMIGHPKDISSFLGVHSWVQNLSFPECFEIHRNNGDSEVLENQLESGWPKGSSLKKCFA